MELHQLAAVSCGMYRECTGDCTLLLLLLLLPVLLRGQTPMMKNYKHTSCGGLCALSREVCRAEPIGEKDKHPLRTRNAGALSDG